jgi:hypothetical protein
LKEAAALEALFEDYPEAMFLFVSIGLRLQVLAEWMRHDRVVDYRRLLSETVAVCERGALATTIVPGSPLRFQARVAAIFVDLALMQGIPEPTPAQLARLRRNLGTLVDDGGRWPEIRREALELLTLVLLSKPTPGIWDEWGPNPLANPKFLARRRLFCSLGRPLFEDWQRIDPRNPTPTWRRTEMEFWAGNIEEAIRTCLATRAIGPENHWAVGDAATLLDKLKEQHPETWNRVVGQPSR